MVAISNYKAFWDYLITVVQGIDQVFIFNDENQLSEIIRDVEAGKVLLVAVIPSTDIVASSYDDYEEVSSCYVFLLKKSDPGNMTHAEFLTEMEAMQVIMTAVKHKLIEFNADYDHCSNANIKLMHRLILSSIHTDPEYNLMGCNGWGIFFKLKTTGV